MPYDNIKSHTKKQAFFLFLEDAFFEKPQEGQTDPPPPPAVLRLKTEGWALVPY